MAAYLVILDSNGNVVGGPGTTQIVDPFRANKLITGALPVQTYGLGATNPLTVGGSGTGSGAGKVAITDLTVTRAYDAVSEQLYLNCCKGTHYPSVDLLLFSGSGTAGQPLQPYAGFGLTNVYVNSLTWSGTSGTLTESATFLAQSYAVGDAPKNADGSLGTFTYVTWNISTNTGG